LADAVAAITTPVVDVHISNVFAREEYRHVSLISKHCVGSISGFGLKSYELALNSFV
jgi:3-dehydroquinate dehydratase-2